MNDLHEATLTARMSEIAMDVLREALHKHDLDMLFLCCCGLVIGKRDRIDEFYGSQDHVERDRVRSFFDTEATGITMTDSINDLRKKGVVSLDFDPYSYSEDRLFEKIECMLGNGKAICAVGAGFRCRENERSTYSHSTASTASCIER